MKIRDTWATPRSFFDWVYERWHPLLDVCASAENTKCPRFITAEQDAFHTPWHSTNGVCWCNPPGSEVGRWVDLCARRSEQGNLTVCCLVQAGLSSRWFARNYRRADTYLLSPRVQFIPPPGIERSSNARDYMLMVFHPTASGRIELARWKN